VYRQAGCNSGFDYEAVLHAIHCMSNRTLFAAPGVWLEWPGKPTYALNMLGGSLTLSLSKPPLSRNVAFCVVAVALVLCVS
jgi:hypothetical protein